MEPTKEEEAIIIKNFELSAMLLIDDACWKGTIGEKDLLKTVALARHALTHPCSRMKALRIWAEDEKSSQV